MIEAKAHGGNVNVLMCADKNVVAGLHVAAYSLLKHLDESLKLRLYVFTDEVSAPFLNDLDETLNKTGKVFEVSIRILNENLPGGFPKMRDSLAPYFRLLAVPTLEAERVLYIDIDTLCLVDVGPLYRLPLNGNMVAMLPETELSTCADDSVRSHPDIKTSIGHYFNSGVLLVDVAAWKKNQTTRKCLEYIAINAPQYWDQSALNVELQGRISCIESRFNFITNKRENWHAFKNEKRISGKLLHFTDFPKPWSKLASLVHPFHKLWREHLLETACSRTEQIPGKGLRRLLDFNSWFGYKKALKDRLLMKAWRYGLISKIKGM